MSILTPALGLSFLAYNTEQSHNEMQASSNTYYKLAHTRTRQT